MQGSSLLGGKLSISLCQNLLKIPSQKSEVPNELDRELYVGYMYDIEWPRRPDGAFPLLECVRSESPRGNLISLRKFLERSLQVEKRGNEREPLPQNCPPTPSFTNGRAAGRDNPLPLIQSRIWERTYIL